MTNNMDNQPTALVHREDSVKPGKPASDVLISPKQPQGRRLGRKRGQIRDNVLNRVQKATGVSPSIYISSEFGEKTTLTSPISPENFPTEPNLAAKALSVPPIELLETQSSSATGSTQSSSGSGSTQSSSVSASAQSSSEPGSTHRGSEPGSTQSGSEPGSTHAAGSTQISSSTVSTQISSSTGSTPSGSTPTNPTLNHAPHNRRAAAPRLSPAVQGSQAQQYKLVVRQQYLMRRTSRRRLKARDMGKQMSNARLPVEPIPTDVSNQLEKDSVEMARQQQYLMTRTGRRRIKRLDADKRMSGGQQLVEPGAAGGSPESEMRSAVRQQYLMNRTSRRRIKAREFDKRGDINSAGPALTGSNAGEPGMGHGNMTVRQYLMRHTSRKRIKAKDLKKQMSGLHLVEPGFETVRTETASKPSNPPTSGVMSNNPKSNPNVRKSMALRLGTKREIIKQRNQEKFVKPNETEEETIQEEEDDDRPQRNLSLKLRRKSVHRAVVTWKYQQSFYIPPLEPSLDGMVKPSRKLSDDDGSENTNALANREVLYPSSSVRKRFLKKREVIKQRVSGQKPSSSDEDADTTEDENNDENDPEKNGTDDEKLENKMVETTGDEEKDEVDNEVLDKGGNEIDDKEEAEGTKKKKRVSRVRFCGGIADSMLKHRNHLAKLINEEDDWEDVTSEDERLGEEALFQISETAETTTHEEMEGLVEDVDNEDVVEEGEKEIEDNKKKKKRLSRGVKLRNSFVGNSPVRRSRHSAIRFSTIRTSVVQKIVELDENSNDDEDWEDVISDQEGSEEEDTGEVQDMKTGGDKAEIAVSSSGEEEKQGDIRNSINSDTSACALTDLRRISSLTKQQNHRHLSLSSGSDGLHAVDGLEEASLHLHDMMSKEGSSSSFSKHEKQRKFSMFSKAKDVVKYHDWSEESSEDESMEEQPTASPSPSPRKGSKLFKKLGREMFGKGKKKEKKDKKMKEMDDHNSSCSLTKQPGSRHFSISSSTMTGASSKEMSGLDFNDSMSIREEGEELDEDEQSNFSFASLTKNYGQRHLVKGKNGSDRRKKNGSERKKNCSERNNKSEERNLRRSSGSDDEGESPAVLPSRTHGKVVRAARARGHRIRSLTPPKFPKKK